MIKIIACLFFCFCLVHCEPPSNSYGVPQGAPLSSYGTPNYNANHDHHDYGEPKSYEFGYQVKDDYTGNNYNRQEQSDGNQVKGEYRVALPDGRTQIVTYWADWQTGFHADVRYEGEAQYPTSYKVANPVDTHYGAPNNNAYNNAGYNDGYNHGSGSFNNGQKLGGSYDTGFNGGYNYNSGDSYNDFGNKPRPSNEYGAP